jgi:hypothetical protein
LTKILFTTPAEVLGTSTDALSDSIKQTVINSNLVANFDQNFSNRLYLRQYQVF